MWPRAIRHDMRDPDIRYTKFGFQTKLHRRQKRPKTNFVHSYTHRRSRPVSSPHNTKHKLILENGDVKTVFAVDRDSRPTPFCRTKRKYINVDAKNHLPIQISAKTVYHG